jgi:membrane-associated phospholipid phosphatase
LLAHYVSDVAAGLLLGMIIDRIVAAIGGTLQSRRNFPR